ncbi:MAG: prolipoprotein diacylglyceryl transferase [Bacteroidales bacterium]|jgi:prolipoprotein diacylglyceryl transferase|nr:prolipoprotein diacylglyceryl transferase [Bacteroidales bacterium]
MICSIVWDVNPIIFELGSFQLRYYGTFFVIGLILSYFIVKKIYKIENLPIKELDKLSMYVVVGGLIGARIGHCLFYEWSYYTVNFSNFIEILLPIKFQPEIHFIGYQGLASHGGALGVIIALFILKFYSEKKSFLWLIDRVVIPTGFAGAFIRLGNLFNSEIYGHQTDLPWGFIFKQNGDTFASHPTQIYEAICYVAISILLLILYKNEKFRNSKGLFLGLFLTLVFSCRFFIEFLKNTQVEFENSMYLNMGQILSIPLILLGLGLILNSIIRLKSKKKIVN